MGQDLLEKWAKTDLAEIETKELRKYLRALQEKSGLYLRAYRTVNGQVRAVEQELEKRK